MGSPRAWDVVLAGDVFYDRALAAQGLSWLRALAAQGALVLLADPARGFLDTSSLRPLRSVRALADGDLSGTVLRDTTVYEVPAEQ